MQRAFERTTTIDASVDRVWQTLVDWEDAPRWMGGVDEMSVDGPTAPGTLITFTARGRDRRSEILAVDDGRRVVLRSTRGPVTVDYTYRLGGSDRRTDVTLTADCGIAGPLALLGPLLRRLMAWADGDQLDGLRDVVEGSMR